VSNWILLNYRTFSLTSGLESIASASYLQIASQSFLSSQTFPTPDALYNAWNRALDVWESRDSKIFIETMVAQYAELVLFWQKAMYDTTGGFAVDFKQGNRENQLMLLDLIRRLAGERSRDQIQTAARDSRRNGLPKKEREMLSLDKSPVSTAVAAPAFVPPTVNPEPPVGSSGSNATMVSTTTRSCCRMFSTCSQRFALRPVTRMPCNSTTPISFS
jgi:hypothetical protein